MGWILKETSVYRSEFIRAQTMPWPAFVVLLGIKYRQSFPHFIKVYVVEMDKLN